MPGYGIARSSDLVERLARRGSYVGKFYPLEDAGAVVQSGSSAFYSPRFG